MTTSIPCTLNVWTLSWLLAFAQFFYATGAFTSKVPQTTSSTNTNFRPDVSKYFRDSTLYFAKPEPKAGFDLDAIEAFESQLLEELEEEEKNSATPSTSDSKVDDTGVHQILGVQELIIPSDLNGKRIDAALSALIEPELSRSSCGSLVLDQHVYRLYENGDEEIIDRKSFKVETGMRIRVSLPNDETPTEIVAQDLPLNILLEDEHMIVLNKAAHMVVHPATGNWDGTVVNALAYYLPRSCHGRGDILDEDGKPIALSSHTDENQEDVLDGQSIDESNTLSFRPGIVHRLDKGTSGVLVVAKTSRALSALSEAFADRRVSKTYLAVTVGNPGNNIKIDKPIGRHPVNRQKMRVVPDPNKARSRNRLASQRGLAKSRAPSVAGRRALSYVDSLAFNGNLALVRVKIETGRTHQVCKFSFYKFINLCMGRNILNYCLSARMYRSGYTYKIDTLQFMATRYMVSRIGTKNWPRRTKSSVHCFTPTSFPWNTQLPARSCILRLL